MSEYPHWGIPTTEQQREDLKARTSAYIPETPNETTQQLADLIIGVRHLEAKAERARLAAEAARKRPHRQTARKPMASSEAYVAVAVAVCLLLGFIAFLYFTH